MRNSWCLLAPVQKRHAANGGVRSIVRVIGSPIRFFDMEAVRLPAAIRSFAVGVSLGFVTLTTSGALPSEQRAFPPVKDTCLHYRICTMGTSNILVLAGGRQNLNRLDGIDIRILESAGRANDWEDTAVKVEDHNEAWNRGGLQEKRNINECIMTEPSDESIVISSWHQLASGRRVFGVSHDPNKGSFELKYEPEFSSLIWQGRVILWAAMPEGLILASLQYRREYHHFRLMTPQGDGRSLAN